MCVFQATITKSQHIRPIAVFLWRMSGFEGVIDAKSIWNDEEKERKILKKSYLKGPIYQTYRVVEDFINHHKCILNVWVIKVPLHQEAIKQSCLRPWMDLLNCVKSKEHKQDRISLKEYLFFKVCFSFFCCFVFLLFSLYQALGWLSLYNV